ncbi:MAG: threonine ammonia-lyase [Candidatus Hermodarchaeota archaeon]
MPNQDYIDKIKKIREFFSDLVHYTPLELNHTFSIMSNNSVYLKLENFQRTGAFKIRGAYNKISKLTEEERKKGVITASAGNHGQAVALAANLFNIKSIVVVPEGAPIVKIEAIKNYNPNGEIIEYGLRYDDAYNKALEIRNKTNSTFVHAYDDEQVIDGQATIGLEVLEQLPDVDYIFCPIGGGGLISGISSYCKQKNKDVRIIGVQSRQAPSMHYSFNKNEISTKELKETICDGIAVKQPGKITYNRIKKYVDDIVLVSDEEVANTILLLLERAKLFVEGAGAAALAAVLYKKVNIKNKKIVVIISGGNLTPNLMNRIITKGLIKGGRLVKFKTKLPDIPGELLKVLKIIAEEKGNIISIIHDRERLELEYKMTEVIIELESRNQEHINQIINKLRDSYEIEILKF